jgi:hypothetical protein
VPVAFVKPSAFDLRQPPQPLELQQLTHPLKLGEVLFDARVGSSAKLSEESASITDRSSLI